MTHVQGPVSRRTLLRGIAGLAASGAAGALLAACGGGSATSVPAATTAAKPATAVPATTGAAAATTAPAAAAATTAPASATTGSTTGISATPGGGKGSSIDSVTLDSPQEVQFWHIQATIYGDAIKQIVADFNKLNAGKITVVETFQGNYPDLNKKVRAAIQGGGVPDVAMAYEPETQEYQTAGTIVPVDDYLASSKYGISDEALKDLMPNVLARQRIKQYGGKTLSWPHGTSSQGVYYNIDLLKKAGFDKPATSFGDFMAQAKTIKEKAGVISFPYSTTMGGTWLNFLRSYGVNFVTDDGKTSNFDKPEALQSLKLLKQMKDDGTAAIVSDTEQEFTNQRTAMEISTTARTSSKIDLIGTKFNWGITLPPQGKADIKVTEMYGGNQVLFKSNPKKQLAGWLFMRYFAGTDAQAIYGQKTGYFPATISSQNTELLKKDYTDHPQKAQAFKEVFPYAKIQDPNPAANAIKDSLDSTINDMLNGKISPEDAQKKIKSEADKALKQFNP
jgi:ABC-type glycerol-3-phosphate transport system substrate-binding protein